MKSKFRTPKEIAKDSENKILVSLRLQKSVNDELQTMADKANITKTRLMEAIMEDYILYVRGGK